MTTNQLRYWELREKQTHNEATRAEQERSNKANESLKNFANLETARSNKANEKLKSDANLETARSNQANEAIKRDTNRETMRSNKAKEVLQGNANYETAQHNRATEQVARDELAFKKSKQVDDYNIALGNQAIEKGKLQETIDHNYATEQQARAELTEKNRSNLVNEAIKSSDVQETIRHNKQTERYQNEAQQLAELENYHKWNDAYVGRQIQQQTANAALTQALTAMAQQELRGEQFDWQKFVDTEAVRRQNVLADSQILRDAFSNSTSFWRTIFEGVDSIIPG